MKNIFFQKPDESPDVDTPGDSPASEQSAAAPADPVAEKMAALEKEVGELKDQALRRQAEFDNFRRRSERERIEYRASAKGDVVKDVMPVLDGLELALKAPVGKGAEIRKGVELVEKQLREVLEKMGLTRMDAEGKPFDPNLHHAVEMVETSEYPDHTIIEV